MSAEKTIRWIALGLVFLFPLVSIFQLRDSDGPWRQAAGEVRDTIVSIEAGGEFLACGLVVQSSPLRIVVAGSLRQAGLGSYIEGNEVHWTPIYTDVDDGFSIFQAATEMDAETVGASSFTHTTVATARFQLDEEVRLHDGVQVALVGPRDLEDTPIWVGVLSGRALAGDRALYHTDLLRAVRAGGPLATAKAHADEQPEIDARLRGAPFVNASGHVVALYIGRSAEGLVGLPIETVCGALAMLHLQAAN